MLEIDQTDSWNYYIFDNAVGSKLFSAVYTCLYGMTPLRTVRLIERQVSAAHRRAFLLDPTVPRPVPYTSLVLIQWNEVHCVPWKKLLTHCTQVHGDTYGRT